MEGNKNIRKEDIKKALDLKWDNIIFASAIIVADVLCCCSIGNIYQKWAIVFASIIVGIIILSIENKASLYIKNIFVASTIIVVDVSCCCSIGNIYQKGAVVFASIILEAVILSIENKESFYIKWDNIIFASAIIVADVLCCCSIGNIYQKCAIVFISIIIGYFILSIENKIEKIKRILNKAISFFGEKRIKDDGRNLLSPCMVDKNSPAYFSVQELLYVSKKEGGRNIALTGIYGSGKSSILKTFMSLLPSRTKVLQISLSNFLSLDAKEEDIEKKVFQHIIFKANQAETAQTDFDRKSVISRNKAYAHAIFLVFIFLCFMLITKSSLISVPHIKAAFSGILGDNKNFYEQFSAWWYVIFSAFVVVYAVYIIKHIIRRVPKLKLKYVGKEGLEFDFDKKDVFNRMLGEIVYFLKAGKYDMVIFEDLDRIEDPRNLFLKLRELNLLINESDDYIKNNKTIRFIYAIRDDVYREELRTKIFDYIIPVIPIVDKFNAGDYLIHNYGKKDQLMSDIKKDDLKELGSYIDNMRTLKNVVNEYRLYKDSIGITGKELLALTIYKNLFPSDYSLLHQKKGCLHVVTSNPDWIEIKQTCEDYLKKNFLLYNIIGKEIDIYAESISTTIEDMLNKGYIPKDIDSFIACFKPNSLIKKDNDFCERIINGEKDNPSFHLEDPWDVVDYLPEEAFKHDGILNYQIADTIFSNYGIDNEKGRLFINTVKNNVQFILDYLDSNNSDETKVKERMKIMFESADISNVILMCIKNKGNYRLQSKFFDMVEEASKQDIADALFILGYCNYYGISKPKDGEEAIKKYKRAARHGNTNAMFNLAWIYQKGDVVNKNLHKAVEWYTKAADQGYASAMYNLALIYEKGDGVEKDIVKAIRWYAKAVEQGYVMAMNNLALIFLNGDDVKKDVTQAVNLYTMAAEQGNANAMYNLALICHKGDGVEKDMTKAIEWYTKAAEQGDDDAMNNLALIYANGGGVEKDMTKAIEWYTKAAEQGHAGAMGNLAWIYENGDGVEKDMTKAIEWYTKASEQGHTGAMFSFAWICENGYGVEKDMTKAIEWYTKAAEQGHTDAMNKLALICQKGDAVEKDMTKAIEWYTKSAEQGDAKAMFNLALIYENGDGVEKDMTKAIELYTKAAEQGDAKAMFNLAVTYHKEDGVEKDITKAIEWYTKAAEQGNAGAMNNLALIYQYGDGVEKDMTKAIEWYTKAAEQGYAGAMNNLAYIYQEQGRYEEALPLINKALELSPDEASYIDTLAVIYQGLGRYVEAMEQYEKALKIVEEEKDEDIVKQIQDRIQELKDLMKK